MAEAKTLTLTEFLAARIDEDEALASAVGRAGMSSFVTPGRVLAECEAKRRLIDRVGNPNWAGFNILAMPYADHPDYLPEWRP